MNSKIPGVLKSLGWVAIFLPFFLKTFVFSQNAKATRVRIETTYDGTFFNVYSDSLFLFLNDSTGNISMKMELSTITTGNNSLDSTLKRLKNHFFLFSGNFPMEILDSAVVEKSFQEHQIKGKVTLNKIIQPAEITFEIIRGSNKSQIGFELEIDPKDFDLGKVDKRLTTTILLDVDWGFLNRIFFESH